MKIDGPNRVTGPQGPKKTSKTGGSGFALETQDGQATRAPASLGAASGLTGVDALLALQGEMDGSGRKKRMAARATDLLDILDDIKISLLAGGYPREALPRLLTILDRQRETVMEPGLQAVLDEIELRARVEAAKLERAA
jgi:hypothetical protein